MPSTVAYVGAQIFAGGHNWQRNMELAKTLVNFRGGPSAVLAFNPENKSRAGAGVFRAKLLLEILAIYDMFGVSCHFWILIPLFSSNFQHAFRQGGSQLY
jgi:hypothetical protein